MGLEWLYTLRRPDEDKVDPPIPVRRIAAVGAVLGYPLCWLALAQEVFTPGEGILPSLVYVGLLLAALVLWAGSVTVVYEFRRRLAQAPDEQLDERERSLRDESYLISYRLLSTAILAVGIAVSVAAGVQGGSIQVSTDLLIWTFSSLLMGSIAMPSSVVAWRDRDVDEDVGVLEADPEVA